MQPARLISLSLVSAAAALPANAFLQNWEVDSSQISEAGQEIFEFVTPRSISDRYEFVSPEEITAFFSPMQEALTGGSLEALAAMQPRARQTLATLRANPNTQGYADWLEARMDYFEMASEVQQALPSPATPTPPTPAPPSSSLPPHPTTPAKPLPPHPASKPLPPHPTSPQPALIPHPKSPQPALIPHPSNPAPATASSPAPAPGIDKARNRYVENKQVWLRKLANRPAPARAASLLPDLKRAFQSAGVPPQLVWQAEAESSFNPAARSPAGAVGLFQFMPGTAQQFGLRLSPDDERLDAVKNARAAAQYLKRLHRRFGNWPLAFAAYNCGEYRVAKLLADRHGTTFDDIHDQLPAETRMYVPKIAALVQLREKADVDRL